MAQLKALILILSNTEKLDPLLSTFVMNDIHGCTIWDSEGMTHRVVNSDNDVSHFGGLRNFLNPNRDKSKTVFFVGTEEEVKKAMKLVINVIGDIDKPDTGVMFTLNVDECFGIHDKDD